MNEKEFEAVIVLPGSIRYEYFIKKVADREEVWGLYNEGWAMTTDDDGAEMIPFWPRKEFAEYCARGEFEGYCAKTIELSEFVDEWLPLMKSEELKPSIFWNLEDSVVLDIDALLRDLETELEYY